MTDKQLKKLKKIDLINLLISQSRQNEDLRKEMTQNARKVLVYERIIDRYLLNDLTDAEKEQLVEVQN